MPSPSISVVEVGVAGILVLLILDRVFSFLKTRGIGPSVKSADAIHDANWCKNMSRQMGQVHEWVRDLYALHDIKDSDGVPVWYVRNSLEVALKDQTQAMSELSNNIATQTRVLAELVVKVGSDK